MKDAEGHVVTYGDDDTLETNSEEAAAEEAQEGKENIDNKEEKQKKLVKKKKTQNKIQSEDTLEMLKSVLGNNKKEPNSKDDQIQQQIPEESVENEEADYVSGFGQTGVSFFIEADKKKKKGKKIKGKKKAAVPMDTSTRFFNSYSESPHLQVIENSYLKYLEA